MASEWVIWFQEMMLPGAEIWKIVTWLGDEPMYLFVFPLIYWCVAPRLGLQTGVLLLFSAQMNASLKLLFHLPRPFWVSERVRALVPAQTFGMPSGHAQNAVVVWGWLLKGWRPWGWVFASVLSVLIGLSRIVLGVHFWGDVIVGALIGFSILVIAMYAEQRLMAWIRAARDVQIFLFALMVAVFWVGLAWWSRARWLDATPASWAEAWSLQPLVSVTGAWLGLILGGLWVRRQGGFTVNTSWRVRGMRALIGLLGVLLLWKGLGLLCPDGETVTALFCRLARYSLVGLWIAGGAPRVFRLMEHPSHGA